MSITRSHSRPAPAIDRARGPALILVAHGDRGGEGRNGALLAHASRLKAAGPFAEVRIGVLNGRPSLEDAVADVARFDRVHVFPMLMSEGYFTATVIPERLGIAGRARGDRRFVLHSPLGLSDAVTALVDRVALGAAREHGVSAPDTTVLLVGHGAKSNGFARDAIEAHARRLTARGNFGRVETAYLEEPPFVADRAALLARPAIAVGMFVSDGLHASEDVPLILEAATGGPIPYTGAIGAHAGIAEIVAAEVLRAEPVAACV